MPSAGKASGNTLRNNLSGRNFTVTAVDVEIESGLNFLQIDGHVEAEMQLFFMHPPRHHAAERISCGFQGE